MALTDKDIRAIAELTRSIILEEVPALIKEAIKGLPTRDEMLTGQDKIMGELQAMRQEHDILKYRVRDHEDRITTLETAHPGGEPAS